MKMTKPLSNTAELILETGEHGKVTLTVDAYWDAGELTDWYPPGVQAHGIISWSYTIREARVNGGGEIDPSVLREYKPKIDKFLLKYINHLMK